MATYYVKTTGDDLKDGLSEANAWATVTKALTIVAAGDTVYIAPGTYRNTSGWTLSTPGTAGHVITIEGDPDCVRFANENPGYVRLTGCDGSELPSRAGALFTALQDYIAIRNLLLDGTTTSGSYDGISIGTGTSRTVERCVVIASRYAAYGATGGAAVFNDCWLMGGARGASLVTVNRCVCLGSAAVRDSTASYCIAIGGAAGFYGGAADKCMSIGGTYGFQNCTAQNSIAIGASVGFFCSVATTVTNCISRACATNFAGTTTPNELTVVACQGCYNGATGSNLIGTITPANHIGFTSPDMMLLLALAFRAPLHFALGTGTGSAPGMDIFGLPTPQYSGTHTPGPYAYSSVTPDYTTYRNRAPGVRINRAGIQDWTTWARKNQTITASIWVRWSGSGSKPRLVIAEDGAVRDSDTASGAGTSWEKLTCQYTATRNSRLQVWAQAQDSDVAAYAIFSDLTVG